MSNDNGNSDRPSVSEQNDTTSPMSGSADHNRVFWRVGSRDPGLVREVLSEHQCQQKQVQQDVDPLCYDAAKFIVESKYASIAELQSQFVIGHPRAVRIMKQLEEFKVVSQYDGTKPRAIILGIMELEQIAHLMGKGLDT